MRLLLKILLPVLLVGVVVWLAAQRFRTTVPVAIATRGSAVDAVTGTVKVFANIDLHLKTEVNGQITEVPVELDQMVKKGDVLVRLDSRDLQMQLEQRRIQYKAAEERLALPYNEETDVKSVKEDLERLQEQANYGGASQAQVEQRKRDLAKAEVALKNARIGREETAQLLKAQVGYLEYQLERMEIKAPMDGKVVEFFKWPGDYVYANNEILRLISPGRWVELTLNEEDSFGVKPGQTVTLRLASYPNETIPATVTSLASFANSDTKTRAAFLSVDAPDEKMVPGLSGEAVLVKAERKDAILVPRRALIGNRVYVVKDGRVEVREVQPGFLSLNKAEIRSGVAEGEQVVLEDQSLLKDGQKVDAVSIQNEL